MKADAPPESELSQRLRHLPRIAGWITVAVGLSVLVGWGLNVAILKSVLPDTVSMKANTAVTFILAGAALLLQLNPPLSPRRRRAGQMLGAIVAVIGAWVFWECLSNVNLGIDELLFRDDTSAVATSAPGRMAPATTVSFILLGLALALFDRKTWFGSRVAEWLATGSILLGFLAITEYLIGDPVLYEFGPYTRMAPHTALLFPVLSLGVLLARPDEGLVGRFRRGTIGSDERRIHLALVVFLLLLLVVGGWFYNTQRRSLRGQAEALLETVAHEKAQDIARWRAERLADGAVLAASPFFRDAVARWLAAPDSPTEAALRAQLQAVQAQYRYSDVFLVDAAGRVAFDSTGQTDPVHARWIFAEAARRRQPALSDLHNGNVRAVHLDVIAPVLAGSGSNTLVIAAVALVCDAAQFLYPMIQTWPVPSDTAESLLVRRDGNEVLFLNELRHRTNTALKFRIPLCQTDVPAVMAVTGTEGAVIGRDDRGVEVFASLHPVPDSPWFLVAKMDAVEALAAWRVRSALILALNFVLVLSALAIALTAWQRAKKHQFIALYRAETARHQSESRHGVTLMSIGDGVIVTDAQQCIELFNPVAEVLTGWKQADASGRPLGEVFHIINEYTRAQVENPVGRVLREGSVVGLANHTLLIARDGTERPIADSAAPVHDAAGAITGIVLVFRDQTDERRAELRVAHLNAVLRAVRNVNQLITQEKDRDRLLQQVCGILTETRGFRSAWIALLDPEGNLKYASGSEMGRGFEDLLAGMRRGQWPVCCRRAMQKDGVTVMHDTLVKCHACPVARTDRDAAALAVALRHAGRLFGVLVAALPAAMADDAEEQALFVEVAGDISFALHGIELEHARRHAEEALHEREDAYRTLIEGLPDIVIRFDRDARHRFVSSNIEAVTGIKAEAFLGKTHREMGFPEPLSAFWEEAVHGVFQSGKPFETEFMFQGRQGKILFNWRLLPEFDPTQQVTSVLSISRDVTEHRLNERARLESERKYRVLFESARDAKLALSPPSWSFTTGNPAALALFGFESEATLTGQSLSTLSPERQPDGTVSAGRIEAMLASALRDGAVSFDWTHRRLNGQEFPATVDLTRVHLDGGEHLFATIRDISTQRSLEAQLLQSQKLESIGLLAGGVAHEINNPIMGIMGYADLIKAQALPKSDDAEYADRIVQLTERVAAIVRNLLAFARQEKQTFSPTRVADIVRDTLALVQTVIRHDQIALDIDVPDDLPPIFCRAQQIQQVVLNIITNARDALLEKYPGPQGTKRISIRARELAHTPSVAANEPGADPRPRRVRLTVEDNGPGIPDAVRERMFNPFFTTKTRGKGTGLGLSISHGIVTAHGGAISVSTRLGEGTRFHIDLPIGPPATTGKESP